MRHFLLVDGYTEIKQSYNIISDIKKIIYYKFETYRFKKEFYLRKFKK